MSNLNDPKVVAELLEEYNDLCCLAHKIGMTPELKYHSRSIQGAMGEPMSKPKFLLSIGGTFIPEDCHHINSIEEWNFAISKFSVAIKTCAKNRVARLEKKRDDAYAAFQAAESKLAECKQIVSDYS